MSRLLASIGPEPLHRGCTAVRGLWWVIGHAHNVLKSHSGTGVNPAGQDPPNAEPKLYFCTA